MTADLWQRKGKINDYFEKNTFRLFQSDRKGSYFIFTIMYTCKRIDNAYLVGEQRN